MHHSCCLMVIIKTRFLAAHWWFDMWSGKTNVPSLTHRGAEVSFSPIRPPDLRLPLLKDPMEIYLFIYLRLKAERIASVKAVTLIYWASGADGMYSDYLGHFAVEYILSKKSVVFSDQYRLYSDMPVSFNMLSAESPWWVCSLLIWRVWSAGCHLGRVGLCTSRAGLIVKVI